MPYRADRRDRAKSFGLVLAVHLALGAALLAGLRAPALIRAAQDRLTTIAIAVPDPPPRSPPRQRTAARRDAAGAPNLAATPASVIVPHPAIRLPTPPAVLTASEAAPVPGVDHSAGAAAAAGPGIGAGGSGAGLGGGGASGSSGGLGTGSGPRWLGGGLGRRDYRAIHAFEVPSGSAAFAIRVDPTGRAVGCAPLQSSGSPELDEAICELLLPRMAFEPARDPSGRPAPGQITYVANWSRH